jgi:hypothetical protein
VHQWKNQKEYAKNAGAWMLMQIYQHIHLLKAQFLTSISATNVVMQEFYF